MRGGEKGGRESMTGGGERKGVERLEGDEGVEKGRRAEEGGRRAERE